MPGGRDLLAGQAGEHGPAALGIGRAWRRTGLVMASPGVSAGRAVVAAGGFGHQLGGESGHPRTVPIRKETGPRTIANV